jgi:two-component SAPR family response regulator
LIPTVQRIVESIEEHRYEDSIFDMERLLMDGGNINIDLVCQLPEAFVSKSPLLLQLQAESLLQKGNLVEAYSMLRQVVQQFAKQGFQTRLLDAIARLAVVCLRIGERHDAQVLLCFLYSEWNRKESPMLGEAVQVLARSAYLIDQAENAGMLYKEAEVLFVRERDSLGCMELYVARLLDRECVLGDLELERILLSAEQKARIDLSLQALSHFIQGLVFTRREQWEKAIEALSNVETEHLSYEYAALCLMRRMEAELLGNGRINEELWIWLEPLQAALHSDLMIQFQACMLRYLQAQWSGNPFETASLQIKLKAWIELLDVPGCPVWLEQWEQRWKIRLQAKSIDMDKAEQGWSISCFGKLKFTKNDTEVGNINWKRKKALELFIYLLLQPDFSAPKDRAMEMLLRQVDVDKMNNQMYVMIHQLKLTLKRELNMANAVLIKDGTLSLNKESIYQVDLVKYHNLIRMGDQAWVTDRELAIDLYNQASRLYGDLAPELHYADWLENYREVIAEKQVGILRKLALHYSSRGDQDLAEANYAQWIDTRPLEEEGYQELIKFLIATGRELEARRWYIKWEQVCRKELGLVPLVETRKLIFGEPAPAALVSRLIK